MRKFIATALIAAAALATPAQARTANSDEVYLVSGDIVLITNDRRGAAAYLAAPRGGWTLYQHDTEDERVIDLLQNGLPCELKRTEFPGRSVWQVSCGRDTPSYAQMLAPSYSVTVTSTDFHEALGSIRKVHLLAKRIENPLRVNLNEMRPGDLANWRYVRRPNGTAIMTFGLCARSF